MIERTFDRNKPYAFVMYGRMSDEKQNPRSPDQQFDEIGREISIQRLPWKCLKRYRDNAISGRFIKKRPGLQEMLRDIRIQTVRPDLVLLDTRMRIGRAEEVKDIRKELYEKFGIYVLSADSHFADPTTPAGRVLTAFDEIRATEDNRTKAHDVLRGKLDQVRRKFWPGGKPPLGFKLHRNFIVVNGSPEFEGSTLIHDAEWVWIVRLIFERADETGEGQTLLAKFINKHPDVPEHLLPIPGSTIGTMLDNELYYGTLVFPKSCTDIIDEVRVCERNTPEKILVVEDYCQPIVSRELWNSVQSVRNSRRDAMAQARRQQAEPDKLIRPLVSGVSIKHLLSGLARCGHCGAAMRPIGPSPSKDPTCKYVYFRCPRAIDGICSNKRTVPKNWLVEQVIELIKESLFGGS
jgi:DNA invertase Pin-like site-specific DNA recombinase